MKSLDFRKLERKGQSSVRFCNPSSTKMIPPDARQYRPKLRHHQGYIACLVVGRQYGRVIMPKGNITVHDATAPPTPTVWPAAIDYARRYPGRVLTIVLALHLLVWTLLPLLLSPNLQLDLVEGLALGKEWQLGYWKHPPLPWWMDDLAFRLTGSIDVVYVLGPLTIIACLAGVWLLARAVVGPIEALVATLALEGIHFYNFSAVKFAHDQLQLPFWVFTSLFFYRAIVHGRLLNWVLAGVFLAGAFWSKYAAVVLAAPLGLFLIFDPVARRTWRTPGPYVMALFFLVVIAPNVWWLVTNDFLPFHYVDERARLADHWYDGCDLLARHNSRPPGNDRDCGVQPALCYAARLGPVSPDHRNQRGGRSTGDYDVGLPVLVLCATCRRTLVRTNYTWRQAAKTGGLPLRHISYDAPRLPDGRNRRAAAARPR